ncbi:MAG TPA: hypothetical protein VFY28_03350 [Candidatus Paceibacterota bacterium]|nr:hypothetical protein [Candidatus Paceibacterota bacterium]
MTIKMILGAGTALALALGGCATAPRYEAPPIPAQEQARIKQVSPMADLDTRGMVYQGPLPPTLAPLEVKTNELGDPMFVVTSAATKKFGEEYVRGHVPKNVKMCARVELQKIYLADLRRQTNAVESYSNKIESQRPWMEGLAYGGYAAGAISAWSAFGQDYGVTYALGTLFPGVANQAIYGQVLDRSDMQVALSLAQSRYWYSQNDFWLDSMGEWCPSFVNWVATNGQIVRASATVAPAAAQASGPTWD